MPAVNPDGTPGNVAADELIESAWGNAVADTIQLYQDELANHEARLDTQETNAGGKITKAGTFGVTTDATGEATIFFGGGFTFGGAASATTVVCNLADPTVGGWVATLYVFATPNAFRVKLWTHTGAAGADVTITVNWIAVGPPP